MFQAKALRQKLVATSWIFQKFPLVPPLWGCWWSSLCIWPKSSLHSVYQINWAFLFTVSSVKGKTTYIDPRVALTTKPKVKGKVKVDTFKTAMDVLKDKNLAGKVVIITGANSGIGKFNVYVVTLDAVIYQCHNLLTYTLSFHTHTYYLTHWATMRPTYFFTCLTPDDFTCQGGSSAA